jgi:UDP:flavonoid glycosyltransferase YjiC (YdhE family)
MRVLFFCHGGGAGHATRSVAIAKTLRMMDPSVETLFVCSDVGVEFVRMNDFDCVAARQPVVRFFHSVQNGGGYGYLHVIRDLAAYFGDEKRVVDRFSPDVVVSDMDFAGVVLAKLRSVRSFLVSHMVELFDYKEVGPVTNLLKNLGLRFLYTLPDAIVVPDIIDAPIPPSLRDKAFRIGVLVDNHHNGGPCTASGSNRRIAVIPSFASHLPWQSMLRSLSTLRDVTIYSRVLPEHHLGSVIYVPPVPRLVDLIAQCDVVVCSGYSTIMEAIGVRKPCVVVPGNSEQEVVAKRGWEKGILEVADPTTLRDKVDELLECSDTRKAMLRRQETIPDGTVKVAQLILTADPGLYA